MANKYDRFFDPDMTQEEYEQIINDATKETIEAQAKKNAAETAAFANIAMTGAEALSTQTGKGATGKEGDYPTTQEQMQNQAVIEQATRQGTSVDYLTTSEKIKADEARRANENLVDASKKSIGDTKVQEIPEKKPSEQPVNIALPNAQAPMQAKINADMAKRANDNLVQTSTNSLGNTKVQELPSEGDVEMRKLQGLNAEKIQLFSDYINQQFQRQKQEEDEMRRQEKADMWSTMGTGLAEAAAGVINMLGVGELNASNQVYHSYSQDWMKKADQNIRENRQRRQSMRDTLDRLNMQMAELKYAQSIKELEMSRQLRKEEEAKELQEQQLKNKQQQYEDALKQQEIENAFKERQIAANEKAQARADKQTDATIALNRARLKDQRDATTTTMLTQGFVPDKNAPGGYRYDPTSAKKWIGNYSSTKPPKDGAGKELYLPVLDADGNINYANVRSREQKDLILKAAITAIKKDLPEEQARQFEASLNMADSDETQEAILLEWIGKSPTMEKALKDFDVNYKGNHGAQKTFTGGQMSGEDFLSALNG